MTRRAISARIVGMRRIIAVAVLMLGLAEPAWAGWDEGLAAYKRGDYATALREWRPLAAQGDAKAQNNLGVMYAWGQLRWPPDRGRMVRSCSS